MALITNEIVAFEDRACLWSYEYDDVGLFITRMMCVNNAPFPTRGTVAVHANGRVYTALVAGGGGALDQEIPTGPAVRLGVTIDGRGRVNGIDWSFAYGSSVT